MPNLTIIQSNIAAALDKTSLTAADHAALREYAARRGRGTAPAAHNLRNRARPSGADWRRDARAHVSPQVTETRNWQDRFSANCRRQPAGIGRIRLSAAERACPHGLPSRNGCGKRRIVRVNLARNQFLIYPQKMGGSKRTSWWPASATRCTSACGNDETGGGGPTPRAVLEKFCAVQVMDVPLPTTDGRTVILTRHTQPEKELQVLLTQLNLTRPTQSRRKSPSPLQAAAQ